MMSVSPTLVWMVFVLCVQFGVFSLGVPDLWLGKCEKCKSLKDFYTNLNFRVIEDRSFLLQKTSKRSMLKILLPNGMEVLLVSDPTLTESAASMSIEAGTWDDPIEYPGMAHFVEHLLFLGTEAYPEESEYTRYILERGGVYNAFTKHDRTNYGFSVPTACFSEVLERFSHLFIDPLFTFSAIQREVHAVHHEFEDAIENDALRVWRILKENGNLKHPNAKFSCGNLQTLSCIKRKNIVQWFEGHYLPEKMHLVLMSSHSLEWLAEESHRYFSRIPLRISSGERKCDQKEITSEKQRGHLTTVRPAFKNRALFLMWELPGEFTSQEGCKAGRLVQSALDHGRSNSLGKILERESLAKEMHVDFWRMSKESAFFSMNIVLTKEGAAEYEKVIALCFQALSQVKQQGIPEYLLKRLQKADSFQMKGAFDSSFEYVMRTSSELIDEEIKTYPDKTYAASDGVLRRANALLSELDPFQCLYFLVVPSKESDIEFLRIEKWMNAEYFTRKIPEEVLEGWRQASPHPWIGFQPEEEGDSQVEEETPFKVEVQDVDPSDPVFIVDDENARVRWVESNQRDASMDAFFCIATPVVSSSAKHMALNQVFVQALGELLEESFSYDKRISWNLEMEGVDFCLFFSTPAEESVASYRLLFRLLKNIEISRAQFERIRKERLDSYPGDPSPIDYAHQLLDSFLRPFYYTKMELYHALLDSNVEEFFAFRASYFDQVFIEGAFLGGEEKEEIEDVWKGIFSEMKPQVYQGYKDRVKQFIFPEEAQSHLVLQKTHRKGNALLLLIESGDATDEKNAIHKLLTVVLRSEFFEGLRTKQQTAYKLYTWNEAINQKVCHCFGMQSSTHAPVNLLYRVESFLHDFSIRPLEILTKERFNLIRDTLIATSKVQKKSMKKGEDADFIEGEIRTLQALVYEDAIQEISQVFSDENRKRIAVLVEGNQPVNSLDEMLYNVPYIPVAKEKFYN